MRMSILNTATTEQMGYGIISFFRLFSPNESNSNFIMIQSISPARDIALPGFNPGVQYFKITL